MPGDGGSSIGENANSNHFRSAAPAVDLVQRARVEIAEIVREVASLSRRDQSRESYFAALVDRTVSAIAAEGAVLWDLASPQPVVAVRTGRTTDLSIDPAAVASHERLLAEFVESRVPAVVPATPDAIDPKLPSNPTRFAAALVPVLESAAFESSASVPRYVLEVFLENEAGVATQRGYLRFIAQMTDYASEFLAREEIRRARVRQARQAKIDAALVRIHELQTSDAVAAELVDATAELFQVDRVALVRISPGKPKLQAVSHVETIDHRGAACRLLVRQAVEFQFAGDQVTLFPSILDSTTGETQDTPLDPFAISRSTGDGYRLILQVAQSRPADELDGELLDTWSRQVFPILAGRQRLESIPFASAYASLTPKIIQASPTPVRRLTLVVACVAMVTMVSLVPTPMLVTMPATLRADAMRAYYAPADGVVEQVEVRHGQMVNAGDVLVRLRDWSLEEQLATLIARRSVVNQRLSRSIASLVSPASTSFANASRGSASDEDLIQQQRLLEDELAGIDEQCLLLQSAQQRLTVRAAVAGKVDAWQTELTAKGRPVRRGETLIRIEPENATWMADVRIDQSRVGVVLDQFGTNKNLVANVASIAKSDEWTAAKVVRCTNVIQSTPQQPGSLGVELRITGQADSTWSSGTPATVVIPCGQRPLGEVLFFDFIRAVKSTLARWV